LSPVVKNRNPRPADFSSFEKAGAFKRTGKNDKIILRTVFAREIYMTEQKINTGSKLNRLAAEKSPYLLGHASNPVDWYPWGKEAIEKAVKEEKPVFLSVGYSSCHWCHVMEKESFEDAEVAELLNKYFVAVKVDREERPDLDQLYMNAVVSINGSGGWPMSVFLTPDLKPFFGASYFPKNEFKTVLARVQMLWLNQRKDLEKAAEQMLEHLKTLDPAAHDGPPDSLPVLKTAFENLSASFDKVSGGFHAAPKFPPSRALMLLMRLHEAGVKNALSMAEITFDRMAEGGIYDQLGGGFHRYSTDDCWLVPHFEKMLYDNANLSAAYIEAWQATGRREYAAVAGETLDYVLREMTSASGGFYTAQDADTAGGEGAYYTWTRAEIESVLGEASEEFCALHGVCAEGNFEGRNILTFKDVKLLARRNEPAMITARKKLLEARGKRPRPLTDDKIIVEYNGLMINSMARAWQALGEEKYLKAAISSAGFIKERLWKGSKLKRYYRAGPGAAPAVLEDYAFLIQGLITLYESTFEEEWLKWALELQKAQDEAFRDEANGSYFNSDAGSGDVVVRGREFYDTSNPNANAVSAMNLLRLYHLTHNDEFEAGAKNIFSACKALADKGPENMAQLLLALDLQNRAAEIAVVTREGDTMPEALKEPLYRAFIPNKVLALKPDGGVSSVEMLADKKLAHGEFTAYVCGRGSCAEPAGSAGELKARLAGFPAFDPFAIKI
jgi:uncharacterized protein YyaL (SSP411 family)